MTTSILGSSSVPKEAFRQLLARKNPNPPYEVLDHYFELEGQWGIRADVLASQMFLETGYLTSWWSQPPRRNMAGIGVTGEKSATNPNSNAWAFSDTDKMWFKGYSFPDWLSAVQCHFAHMSAYVYPDERNNASKLDPRYSAARGQFAAKGWPTCSLLTDLNGRWAVPGTTYGQSIQSILDAATTLAANLSPVATPDNAVTSSPASNPEQSVSSAQTATDNVAITPFSGTGTAKRDSVYVFDRPDSGGALLRTVNGGTTLQLSGFTDGGETLGAGTRWYNISPADGGGWVYAGDLTLN